MYWIVKILQQTGRTDSVAMTERRGVLRPCGNTGPRHRALLHADAQSRAKPPLSCGSPCGPCGNRSVRLSVQITMSRISISIALLAFLTLVLLPGLLPACHHHDDAAPHASSDCDCGCICHLSLDAVVKMAATDLRLPSSSLEIIYLHPRLEPPPNSLDRPPKLFS